MERFKKLQSQILKSFEFRKDHLAFYAITSMLGIVTTTYFLINSEAGRGWAAKGLPLDDTWIHLVYAKNLAEHGWFFYNPGVPAAGMSSPLWVILLAIPLRIGLDPSAAAKVLSILFGLIAPIVIYHLALEMTERPLVAWIAGIFAAVEPNLGFARVSGMEVTLLAFLMSLALLFLLREEYSLFGLVLGLGVITRGEVAIFGIVVGGIILARQYIQREELTVATMEEIKLAARLFLPSLLLGGAWTVFNFSVSGTPLPNTYYVKHNYDLGLINPENLYNIWMGYFRHAALTRMWLVIPVAGLFLVGAYALIKKLGFKSIPILVMPWLFVFSLSNNLALNPAEWNFTARRYLDFIWPVLAVPVAYGIVWLWEYLRSYKMRWLILGAPLAYGAFGVALMITSFVRLASLASEYSWNCRNIEEVSVAMGKWVKNNLPPGGRIGVSGAGALRYFGGRETFDLLGLNLSQSIGRPLDELILEYQPEFLILFRSSAIDSWSFLEEVFNIKPERNTILGGSDLVVYEFLGNQ